MSSTSGGNSWLSAGEAALGGILSYESGQSTSVPANSGSFTNPDIASLYYGQNQYGQPTVGASSGISTGTLLLVGVLLVAGLVAYKLVR